jgi:hypothetical protein
MNQFLAFRATRTRDGSLIESQELKSIIELRQGAICLPVDGSRLFGSGVACHQSRNFFGASSPQAGNLGSLTLYATPMHRRLHFAAEVEVLDERNFSAWLKPLVATGLGGVPANIRVQPPQPTFESLPPFEEAERPGDVKRDRLRRLIGSADLHVAAEGYFELRLYGMTAGSRLIWAAATLDT